MFPYTIGCLHMKLYGILKVNTVFPVHNESFKKSQALKDRNSNFCFLSACVRFEN